MPAVCVGGAGGGAVPVTHTHKSAQRKEQLQLVARQIDNDGGEKPNSPKCGSALQELMQTARFAWKGGNTSNLTTSVFFHCLFSILYISCWKNVKSKLFLNCEQYPSIVVAMKNFYCN